MAFLSRIDIWHVRNIGEGHMAGLKRLNMVVGANGSGKTSILESMYLLGMGRSFRATSARPVISRGDENCVVSGLVRQENGVETRLGVQRGLDGSVLVRSDGVSLPGVAGLAEKLPLQLLDPDSFGLVSGGPKARRRFLDWGVFHVEHAYLNHWQRFQRALRQRNSILRHGRIDSRQLVPFTRELVAAAEAVDGARRRYLELFLPVFNEFLAQVFPGHGIHCRYYSGWESGAEYHGVLDRGLERDLSDGYTRHGPQRADLRMRVDQRTAGEVLSRGQQKMLVCAMKLAQGSLLARTTGRQCVYLVDDLAAELDETRRRSVVRAIDEIGAQAIFTTVDETALGPILKEIGEEPAMFHVEHGRITASQELCQ